MVPADCSMAYQNCDGSASEPLIVDWAGSSVMLVPESGLYKPIFLLEPGKAMLSKKRA